MRPPPQHLEQHVVAEQEQQARRARTRCRRPTPPRAQNASSTQRDQQRVLDDQVERERHEARAEAGQRERELDAFRRGDRADVLILHRCVNLERFEAERAGSWTALEAALRRAGDRPERLGADGVRELGALYRAAAADLAFARRRFPGDPRTRWLEALVVRARGAVYARVGPAGVAVGVPVARLLAAAGRAAGARAGRLAVPARARRRRRGLGRRRRAGAAAGIVPGQFQAAADPPAAGRDYTPAEAAEFSVARDDQQHPGDAGRVRRRDRVRRADRAGARLQRAAAGDAGRAGGRRRPRDRVPAPGLRARAAGALLHRRAAGSPGCAWAGR